MRRIYSLFILIFLFGAAQAQTLEELKAEKDTLESQINALKASVEAIEKNIKENFPDYGWKFGLTGTVGVNLSGFNNWACRIAKFKKYYHFRNIKFLRQ